MIKKRIGGGTVWMMDLLTREIHDVEPFFRAGACGSISAESSEEDGVV